MCWLTNQTIDRLSYQHLQHTSGKIVVFVVSKDGLTEAQQTLPNGIPSNDPSLPDLDTPLYVLVNSNTASAAEVLAGALKVRDYFFNFILSYF